MRNYVIGLFILVLAAAGLFFLGGSDEETTTNDGNSTQVADADLPSDINEQAGTDIVVPTNYVEYSEDNFANAAGTDRVLFFHAGWCPTCRSLDENLTMSEIPSDVTILKTDYDSSPDLRQQYGVNVQHTLVQVDENGDLVNSWYGSYNIDEILANL